MYTGEEKGAKENGRSRAADTARLQKEGQKKEKRDEREVHAREANRIGGQQKSSAQTHTHTHIHTCNSGCNRRKKKLEERVEEIKRGKAVGGEERNGNRSTI